MPKDLRSFLEDVVRERPGELREVRAPVDPRFEITAYGARYAKAWIATNGFLTFDRPADNSINREVPNSSFPNAAVFAYFEVFEF